MLYVRRHIRVALVDVVLLTFGCVLPVQRKAGYIKDTAEILAKDFNSDIPGSIDELVCRKIWLALSMSPLLLTAG